MRDHRPTATDELIQASKLKQIQEHAKAILLINRQLQDILPKGLKPKCAPPMCAVAIWCLKQPAQRSK